MLAFSSALWMLYLGRLLSGITGATGAVAASVIADTEYGAMLTAAVANGNVYGCQFHPEKSGDVGMRILKAFCEIQTDCEGQIDGEEAGK